uniref:Spore coat associated protein CotJA n=1 Tax=Ascaris lumbricoides TaxID=6252 RepID=A0A0M3HFX8_ASCLU
MYMFPYGNEQIWCIGNQVGGYDTYERPGCFPFPTPVKQYKIQ